MIVETALKLFLRGGFSATSMDEVAVKAGISKGTLYSRFSTKADLFQAAVMKLTERHLTLSPKASEGRSLEERLFELSVQFLAVVLTKEISSLECLMLAEAKRFPYLASLVQELATMRAARFYEEIFRDAASRNEIQSDNLRLLSEDLLQLAIMAPLRRAALGVDDLRITHVKLDRLRFSIRLILNGVHGNAATQAVARSVGGSS